MKKRTLLTGVFCATLSLTSFGQQVSTENHTTPPTVLAISTLKSQSEKIDKKEQEINAAATSSRAVMTQLKQELTSLNQEYKILLSNAISTTTDAAAKSDLEKELHFVEQQLTPQNPQR